MEAETTSPSGDNSAGAALASYYPRATEVACLGDLFWARYGGLKVTAVIDPGHGEGAVSAAQICQAIDQNSSALDLLRQKHISVIVSEFERAAPCSSQWRPLEKSRNFYYLPL
jgi:hypothetical protein